MELSGSGIIFPDPAKSFGSDRIRFRIRNHNTSPCVTTLWTNIFNKGNQIDNFISVSVGTFVIPFGSGSKSGSGSPKTKRSGSDRILIYNTVFYYCIVALPAVIIATTVRTVHIIDKEKFIYWRRFTLSTPFIRYCFNFPDAIFLFWLQ
jgi:hypothetical protein